MSDITVNVTSDTLNWEFAWDWACPTCACYGYIKVTTTGGAPKPGGGMYPKTSDEDIQRLRWQAHHRASSGICINRRLIWPVTDGRPVLWRRQFENGKWKMIVLPDTIKGEYAWPPRRPPWVAR